MLAVHVGVVVVMMWARRAPLAAGELEVPGCRQYSLQRPLCVCTHAHPILHTLVSLVLRHVSQVSGSTLHIAVAQAGS